MSSLCWSLPHLLSSSLPQHQAPPGQRDLLQEDTVHQEPLSQEPLPNAPWSESDVKEPLSHINYESGGNPRPNTPTIPNSRKMEPTAGQLPAFSVNPLSQTCKSTDHRTIGRPYRVGPQNERNPRSRKHHTRISGRPFLVLVYVVRPDALPSLPQGPKLERINGRPFLVLVNVVRVSCSSATSSRLSALSAHSGP